MGEHNDNLDRVSARIGATIREFYRLKIEAGEVEFHVEELRRYVRQEVGMVAPNSPYRIMWQLREDGRINYSVVSRSASLYRIEPISHEPPPTWHFNGEDQGELF